MADTHNVLLIVNPVAGRRLAQSRLFQIVDMLTKSGAKTVVFTTSQKGDATEIVKSHGKEAQRIICCGGDGTLNEVVTGLEITKLHVPVGYIPTGTTNDLARALNLPVQMKKAIQTAIYGDTDALDIGMFNREQYFTYVASFGAFTKVAYETPQWAKNTMGHASYVISGIIQVGDIRPHLVKVVADGVELTGEFIFGSVSNSTVVGGVIKFPESDIRFDDGLFEVLLVRNPTTPLELGNMLNGVINRQYDDQNVYFFKTRKLALSFEEETHWTIDGEYAGSYDSVHIENHHRAVQIVMSYN